MGKHIIRQTPQSMPTSQKITDHTRNMDRPYVVAGCRGITRNENRNPDYAVHGTHRYTGWDPASVDSKHVVTFIHGYNCTIDDALDSAAGFFSMLQASLKRDQIDLNKIVFVLFTWPGDTGTAYFDDAQAYAQHSGVALFQMAKDLADRGAASQSFITHSLGAHVGLRSLAVLGERLVRGKADFRVDRVLLLAPAVEDDVFCRAKRSEEYHFPESAFGMRRLHMVTSRNDTVLAKAFRFNESDRALGFAGPQTMDPLVSLRRRVREVLGDTEDFTFEIHDFSSSSPTIMNPKLHVGNHADYWTRQEQTDYYVNLVKLEQSEI